MRHAGRCAPFPTHKTQKLKTPCFVVGGSNWQAGFTLVDSRHLFLEFPLCAAVLREILTGKQDLTPVAFPVGYHISTGVQSWELNWVLQPAVQVRKRTRTTFDSFSQLPAPFLAYLPPFPTAPCLTPQETSTTT